MNQKGYEKAKAECWAEFCKDNGIDQEVNIGIFDAFNQIFDRAHQLGKLTETITQEEIEKAAEKFADRECEIGQVDRDALHKGYYHGMKDALGKQEKDADTVISGWVARDRDSDLYIYTCKPERNFNLGYWDGNVADVTPSNDLFPDLTWELEPLEVEIIIKRKKKTENQ